MDCLERQIIRCRWCLEGNRCGSINLRSCRSNWCFWGWSCFWSGCGSSLSAIDTEGTNIVEPASVIFVSINVEMNCQGFTNLNVEGLKAVNAKNVENQLARKLSWYLHNI